MFSQNLSIRGSLLPFVLFVAITFTGCQAPFEGKAQEEAPISGFKPINPGQRVSSHASLFWEKVGSLQPTFQWEPFPGLEQSFKPFNRGVSSYGDKPFVEVGEGAVSDVTYEIKIWKAESGDSGDIAYHRSGIVGTSHRIETPLLPKTRYLWTIRARFLLNGEPRLTEWSMSSYPAYFVNFVEECLCKWCLHALCTPREAVRKLGTIPRGNLFHFQTESHSDDIAQAQSTTGAPEKKTSSSNEISNLALAPNDCDGGCDGKWVASIYIKDPVLVRTEILFTVRDRKFSQYAVSDGRVRIELNGEIDENGTLRGYCGVRALRGGGPHGGSNFSSEFGHGKFTASGLFKSIDDAPSYRIIFRRSGA